MWNKQHKGEILIVDDDIVNQAIITTYLTSHNYKTFSVYNAKEALLALEESNPDLILLDIMMPGMSGLELCKLIRKQLSLLELPIIFLTAQQREETLEKAFESGGNDYLTKPFKEGELLSRIQIQLTLKRTNQKLKSLRQVSEKLSHEKRSEKLMPLVLNEIFEQLGLDGACLLKDKKTAMSLLIDSSINSDIENFEEKCITFIQYIEDELTFIHSLNESDRLHRLLSYLFSPSVLGSHWAFLQIDGCGEYTLCLYKRRTSPGFCLIEIEYLKNLLKGLKELIAGMRTQPLEANSNEMGSESQKWCAS